ncbi:MAG: leucine-rich repeat protein [Solobacterium sp.]|nr:leucine-rich repeat protein [Solobacterium sp.]
MLNNKNRLMTWMLSFLLCFSNSFVVYGEEMTAPETAEEPAAEKAEETSEIPESSEDPVFEEALSEEEVTEPEENVTASEESQEQETEEVQTPEEQEFSEEEMPAEAEEEPIPEETESLSEETSEIPSETEEADESELYAAETDSSNFTYDVGTDGVTITKYKGKETSVVVPYVIEGKPVTTIGNYAFSSDTNIVNVVLPDSVTSLGDQVFTYCSKLESVTLPAGITAISESIFERCTSLKNVNIPAGVTSIGKSAFRECSSLAAITIPDTVETIDAYAFYKCSSLTTVVVPDSVVSLGDYVFAECTGLTNVKLPEKLSKIPGSLFYHCTSLPDFVFSENVTEIGGLAFAGCTSLEHVIIPATVTQIASDAFKSCPGLTTIGTIGSGKNIEIGYGETLTSMYRLSGLYNSLTSITIPAGVKTIGKDAFKRLNNLKEVIIPDTVITMEDQIFFENTGISHVVIPGSVTSCGSKNFYNCPNIKTAGPIGSGADIEFGWTETIPAQALRQSTYLTDVTLPEGITSIGGSAFAECTRLVNIDLPDTLTSLGIQAFLDCTSLTEITLPDSLTNMEKEVFEGCSGLVNIKLSKNVTKFGDMTFWGCSSLKSIELPEGFIGMGDSVFEGCTSLESIYLPESMTDMGHSVFENCTSLKSVVLPKNVEFYGYLFRGCTNLETVVWPIGFTYIPAETFEDCTNLKHVDMTHVNNIGSLAFKNCTSLEHIDAERIDSIDTAAFQGCTSLKTVSFIELSCGMQYDYSTGQYANMTLVNADLFNNCTSLEEIWISMPGGNITIGTRAFMNCPDGIKIHFFGTESQWAGKTVGTNNEPLNNAVMIYESVPTQLSLSQKEIEIGKGQSMQLKYTVTPSSYNKDYLVWYSDKPGIVSVDKNGVITANSAGSTDIHLTAPGSAPYLTCKVTVGTVKVKGVSIAAAPDMVSVGNVIDLDPVFVPENAENQNVTWSSSDSSIASVDQNGIVKGIKVGTVTITVKTEDGGYTAEKEITVVQPVTGVDINETELRLAINDTYQLIAAVKPEDAGNQNVTWSSDHEDIVSVDETGLATAHADGTAVITAKTEDGGYTAQCTITAYTVRAISINIDEEESASEIEFGATGRVQVVFDPLNTTNQKLSWSSSNEAVATVDQDGLITAVSEGVTLISATSEDGGFTVSREIKVYFIHAESVEFINDSYSVTVGNTVKVEAAVLPENATMKDVVFTSDHPEIASVSEDGTVTGVSEGSAIITATTKDGDLTAETTVTVLPAGFYVKEIDEEYAYTGTAIKPVPEVYDSGKLLTAGKDYTVTYKNNTNAYTYEGEDRSSFEPAKGDKTPYILITGKGNYSGKTYVPFSIGQIDINDTDKVYIEQSITLKANGKVQRPVPVITFNGKTVSSKEYTLTYLYSEDPDSEEIVLDKKTGPKLEGTYTIRITGKGNNFTGTKDVTLRIAGETNKQKAVALSKAITITAVSEEYDGNEKLNASITPKAAYEGIITEDDYTVAYTKNVNAGTATVTATGKGIYTGTVKKTFKITPRLYADHKDEFRFEVNDAVYSKGGAIPEVHVYWNEEELIVGTDYTLKYTNNKQTVTDGKVKITFKGNFKGSAEEQPFKITKKDIALVNITAKDLVYKKGKYKSTPVLIDIDGKKLKAGADYLKTYEYTGNIIDGDAQPETEITVTVTGTGNYTGSVSTTYRILETGKDISKAVFKIANQEYTGSEILITDMSQFTGTDDARNAYITVNKQKEYLVLGEDFEVVPGSYVKNINKGTAKVTFRGINEYGGTKTVSFKIGQRSISDHWNGIMSFFADMF